MKRRSPLCRTFRIRMGHLEKTLNGGSYSVKLRFTQQPAMCATACATALLDGHFANPYGTWRHEKNGALSRLGTRGAQRRRGSADLSVAADHADHPRRGRRA